MRVLLRKTDGCEFPWDERLAASGRFDVGERAEPPRRESAPVTAAVLDVVRWEPVRMVQNIKTEALFPWAEHLASNRNLFVEVVALCPIYADGRRGAPQVGEGIGAAVPGAAAGVLELGEPVNVRVRGPLAALVDAAPEAGLGNTEEGPKNEPKAEVTVVDEERLAQCRREVEALENGSGVPGSGSAAAAAKNEPKQEPKQELTVLDEGKTEEEMGAGDEGILGAIGACRTKEQLVTLGLQEFGLTLSPRKSMAQLKAALLDAAGAVV